MTTRSALYLGLYDGLACDGVDAALVRVAGRGEAMKAELVAHAFHRLLYAHSDNNTISNGALGRFHGLMRLGNLVPVVEASLLGCQLQRLMMRDLLFPLQLAGALLKPSEIICGDEARRIATTCG